MANHVVIAIDAMGGDYGVDVTIPAALKAILHHPELALILVGDQATIKSALAQHHAESHDRIKIRHTSQQISMDESPASVLRAKKDSSMRVAIELVKAGEARACVSAGNTGALMVLARFVLKTLPGIERPAIIAQFPGLPSHRGTRVLDLGANVDSSAEHLYQFAVMGSVLVSAVDNNPAPKIGLLNIGVEEIKGNDQVKRTAQLLAESELNYVGYVEGDAIFTGKVDVVVCDGFVGNVALKTIEGAAKLIGHYAKQAFTSSPYNKLAGLLAKPVIRGLRKQLDPRRFNGATFIGLNGIVVKSHGSADIDSFSYAIQQACLEVEKDVLDLIRHKIGHLLEDAE